jgi:hypothetical protein
LKDVTIELVVNEVTLLCNIVVLKIIKDEEK